MSQASPLRPARRAAARRKQVVESDEDGEDDQPLSLKPENGNEDPIYSPVPIKLPRRPSRRQTHDPPQLPSPNEETTAVCTAKEDKENEDVFSPIANKATTQKRPTAGRRSVRAGRKSTPNVPDTPSLPTPRPSNSPGRVPATPKPLADITEPILNSENSLPPTTSAISSQKPVSPLQPLERPMDIVVRTRAKAIPQVQDPPSSRSRMVITYLVLTNFKSYAGRQEVGPFHSSFSSVVGPNGSGKSNVIDSLLFVFGFRASKMRQGKISSLIHNSAGFLDLDFCEVEVHFEEVIDHPSGAKETVPNSKLIISRKAFKNNSSKYYIDGKESNFTTVTTLLRDHGVDLDHKRFLILQGEVESIAQMKPKAANEHDDGLLEYLEDIVGTSKYKSPIEASATETETLNEVCREKNTRVQHVEKEKTGLEGKKNAALAYVKDENDLTLKQSALWQIFIHECEDNHNVTDEAISQLQSQLAERSSTHKGREQEITKATKQHAAGVKQFEHMQQSHQALLKQLAKADKESVKFDEKRKHLQARKKKLEKTASTSEAGALEAAASLQRLQDDLVRNNGSVAELEESLQEEVAALTAVRNNLRSKTQGLSDEITAKEKLLEPWQEQINQKRSAMTVARSELEMLRVRDNAGEQALTDVKERTRSLEADKVAKTSHLRDLKTEAQNAKKQVAAANKTLSNLASEEPGARTKLSVARQRVDEAKASLSHSQNQGSVLSGLMRLKDSGRISGFHGRLGNLGAIDEQYDVAISTACPALDNLVVDSVEVGQQCIDFLRKNNLGRANFILLDRLPKRDLDPVDTPEDAPRLFDLVKAKDPKFLPAFYSVLQNTLVANDLAEANRLAFGAKRWRVVTLDGQLIDKSGTMSGGGTRVAKGAMSAKLVSETSKEQVMALEQKHETEESRLQEIRTEQQDLQSTCTSLSDRLSSLETEMQKTQLEIESIDRNISDLAKRLTELNAPQQPTKTDASRTKELDSSINKLEVEIEELSQSMSGLELEIKELQEKIMEVGGVKLRGQKAKVDGIKEQLATLGEEIASAEVAQAKTKKTNAKHAKAKEDAVAEVATVDAETEQLSVDVSEQSNSLGEVRREAEEAQEALEIKKDELATYKAELDQRMAELNETRGAEIEMRNQLEENQKILNENNKRLKYWQEKLGKLALQDLGDLEQTDEEQNLPSHTRDELADLDKNVLKGEIAVLEEKTQKANVDLGVLAEYRRRVEEHKSRSTDLAEAVALRDAAKKRCEDLRRIRLEGFMEGFSIISMRLKEMYQMITMGGNAELELVDSLDPFSEGILFSVMPPKKSWKNISNLSGGEKTLSSLALVFALHHYKPTPLYVMDEIDAALDFRNVSIVASYIKERTKNAQFIVISLRNNMFELASRLVGVYKVNHMTKSVTVENRDYIDRSRAAN